MKLFSSESKTIQLDAQLVNIEEIHKLIGSARHNHRGLGHRTFIRSIRMCFFAITCEYVANVHYVANTMWNKYDTISNSYAHVSSIYIDRCKLRQQNQQIRDCTQPE